MGKNGNIISTRRPMPMSGRAHAVHVDSLRIRMLTACGPDADKARAKTRQAFGVPMIQWFRGKTNTKIVKYV